MVTGGPLPPASGRLTAHVFGARVHDRHLDDLAHDFGATHLVRLPRPTTSEDVMRGEC